MILLTAIPSFASELNNSLQLANTHNHGEDSNNSIQRYPAHLCHTGPDHRECEYLSTHLSACDCYYVQYKCCCGYLMDFFYVFCEEHRN